MLTAGAGALMNARWHKERTHHAGTHLVGHQAQIIEQRLAEGHHRVLADAVSAQVGRCHQPSHAGGVDDVTLPRRVLICRCQHQRCEDADAVDDTPQVDVEHPLPVIEREVRDATHRSDSGVVAHNVDATELRLNLVGQALHISRL